MVLGVAAVVAASWILATARGAVPIALTGDESGRLLEGYARATPSAFIRFVTDMGSWTEIHPPLDVAFRSLVNMVLGQLIDDPGQLIRANQTIATLFAVTAVAALCVGLQRFGTTAVIIFLAFGVPSASLMYIAHHAVAESMAIGLAGIGGAMLMRDRFVAGGVVVGIAGLVRPEVALVFATLGVIPLESRRFRRAVTFAALAAGPAVVHTAIVELGGSSSYATVRLWADRPVLDVAFAGIGPKVYWGLGIAPWVGLAAAVVVIVVGVVKGVPPLSSGRLLLAGWMFWSLVFAYFAAKGAIPTHARTYVPVHLLGAVALGVSTHEVAGGRRSVTTALTLVVVAILAAVLPASATARAEWRSANPADLEAVNGFFARSGGGTVLTDWMRWREWTAALYSIEPGGDVCNYGLCTSGSGATPPPALIAGLTDVEVERLTQAWRFLDDGSVRFIAMLNDDEYAKWRTWEAGAHPDVLSSFVRPLLIREGACFSTTAGLPHQSFCPVFESGRFVVLERTD